MQEVTDLADLDVCRGAEEGAELQLRHPTTGTPLQMWITLLGFDSETYRDKHRDLQKRRNDRLARAKRVIPTPKDLDAEAVELLAGVSRGWRGEMKLEGQPLPAYSYAEAIKLYTRFPWIREQADGFVADRANFIKASATP